MAEGRRRHPGEHRHGRQSERQTGLRRLDPATDGRRVYAIFARRRHGRLRFRGRISAGREACGIPKNAYGHASSLAMYQNLVIVQLDQGYRKATSCRADRPESRDRRDGLGDDARRANSWPSPIVIQHEGQAQIITAASPWVIAYSAADGKELWRAERLKGDVGPSPVCANGLVYVANEFPAASAIRLGGSGDVTKTHMAFVVESGLPNGQPAGDGQVPLAGRLLRNAHLLRRPERRRPAVGEGIRRRQLHLLAQPGRQPGVPVRGKRQGLVVEPRTRSARSSRRRTWARPASPGLPSRTAASTSAASSTCSPSDCPKPTPKPGVKVEFRRAENQPGEGLVEAAVAGTAQKIYLHASADVTNADIAEARAALDGQQKPVVEITFTEEGAKKMAKLTAEHQNKPLAILVDGKVIGATPRHPGGRQGPRCRWSGRRFRRRPRSPAISRRRKWTGSSAASMAAKMLRTDHDACDELREFRNY